jgi:hypothetical protein
MFRNRKYSLTSAAKSFFFSTASWILICSVLLNGCVMGYRGYPHVQFSDSPPPKTLGHYSYDVQGVSLFGGYSALQDFLKKDSPFQTTEISDDIPPKGFYVRAKIQTLSPSIPSFVFGAISFSMLTFIPMWSTKDGFIVVFEVYRDGEKIKSFDYGARRTTVGWIVLLPFVWVNLFTASEEKVFRSIGKQFFEDAAPIFVQPN